MITKKNLVLKNLKTLMIFALVTVLFTLTIPASTQAAVSKKNISKAAIVLENTYFTYSGKARTPNITVTDGKTKLKKNKDFTVSYTANINVGKAYAVIKGKGKYSGTLKKAFRILPKGTSVSGLTASSHSFAVQWKKQTRQTFGYQIQYSTNKTFKTEKQDFLIPDSSITEWEFSGLKPETTYYVRVRTYQIVKNKNYYSAWSAKKEVTTNSYNTEGFDLLAEKNADIALQVLKENLQPGNNTLFSPFSLYEDLAMATNSAKAGSVTLAELESYLGSSIGDINKLISNYNAALPGSIHVANSIWINELYGPLNEEFKKETENSYQAKIESVPYNSDTVQTINSWVKENTHEMIPQLIDSLEEDEVMHLINAVAFESEWKTPYMQDDIRENETFINAKGKKEDCTMLYSTESEYVDLTDESGNTIAYGFVKPYTDGRTAFLGLLPNGTCKPENILEQLNGSTYASMYQNKRPYVNGTLNAGIPEFTLDDKLDLVEAIKKAGVEKAFTNDAEFNKMLQTGTPLHINSIQQKTHIEVDRFGTKAAAATDISMEASSAFTPKVDLNIILNKPFVYAIVDLESGLPYFMGVQYSVAK